MTNTNPPLHPALAAAAKVAGPPHARKAACLMTNWAGRAVGNGIATARVLALSKDPNIWDEIWQMQAAVLRRQFQLQNNWMQGWAAWTKEWTQVKGANTMSKLVEQEFDLMARLQQMWSDQATDVVTLLENIDVDYSYWLNGK